MLKKIPFLKFKRSAQDGMSLVGVLVAVGLLGVFAYLTMTSVSNNLFVRKVARIQRSYENLDHALVNEIKDRMLTQVIENQCNSKAVNVATQLSNLELIEGSRVSISNSVWTGTVNNSVKGAVERCKRPRITVPVNVGDDYYFCMKFSLDKSAVNSGDLKSVDQAFVEVKVELVDFSQNSVSGDAINCSAYRSRPSAGIRMTYMTYLRYNNGNNSVIKESGGFHLFPKDM